MDSLAAHVHPLSQHVQQNVQHWLTAGEVRSFHHRHRVSWRKLALSKAKLKAASRTSALLSGFAMVGLVEINFSEKLPHGLLVLFGVTTVLLVSVHLLALLISVCILPHLEEHTSTLQTLLATAPASISTLESPHESMEWYINVAWVCSTAVGILLFLSEVAVILWVKFYPFVSVSYAAPIASSTLLIPVVLIVMVFAVHFYRRLIAHKFRQSSKDVRELETLMEHLDVAGRAAEAQGHEFTDLGTAAGVMVTGDEGLNPPPGVAGCHGDARTHGVSLALERI